MENQGKSKLKLLYVMQILLEKTDEDHPITVQEIMVELKTMGLNSERKSIYDYIELLQEYGLDIICRREKRNMYFVGSREFELPELKLMIDAVQYSKFITQKKSEELIRKINSLTSEYAAKQLVRQVYVTNRLKIGNESIYYSVDMLHYAIATKHKISFKYFDYNLQKERKFKKNGESYNVTPCFMCWDDENYYLVTYNEKYKHYVHFRIDKMVDVKVLEDSFDKVPEDLDVMKYSAKIFNMYGGEDMIVSLQFDNNLIGVVIDRFGHDVIIVKMDEHHFRITVPVVMSPTFLAWMFQFDDKIRLLGPQPAVDRMQEMLAKTLRNYIDENLPDNHE